MSAKEEGMTKSEIFSIIGLLATETDALGVFVDQLEAKLNPILKKPAEKILKEDEPKPNDTILGEEINASIIKIIKVNYRLDRILERCGL